MRIITRVRIARVKEEIRKSVPYQTLLVTLGMEFGIAPRSVDYYITKAKKELEEERRSDREFLAELASRKPELFTGEKNKIAIGKLLHR